MAEDKKLQDIREGIDKLDMQIQQLINERASLAQQVGALKESAGDGANFYRPEREAQVLQKIKNRNQGPLGDEEMARLFRELMSACLALEKTMTIAYLGPEGTFTQAAALKHFGHSVKTCPLTAIDEVFREIEAGGTDYGVVPVENSTEGVVNHTLDMLLSSPLKIIGEVELRIHHHLLSQVDDMSGIKIIYSHGQSLAQCREWLDAHLSGVARVSVSSNAEAARLAANEAGAAAIAGSMAAEQYELPALAKNIEDHPDNTTRFLVLGKQLAAASGDDKTSLLVATRNQSGALFKLLNPLASNNISMTRIESRPTKQGIWEYVFFIDIDGHMDDPTVASALRGLEKETSLFKVLGSYPKAVL